MLNKSRLAIIADQIKDSISLSGVDQYCIETCIAREDFCPLVPLDFDGSIYAVDGSNAAVCDWSVANLNRIRAGFVVYRGSDWKRTVLTFDDLFLADPKVYSTQFDICLKEFFGLEGLSLVETELERLSAYFRELQEYIALMDAINEAGSGDLVLYDGGFAFWKSRPLGAVIEEVFLAAKRKKVDLLGVSKTSAFSWGDDVSRPFIQHTGYAGSMLSPGVPWYLCLSGKKVEPDPDGWEGRIYVARLDGRAEHAFRIDAPSYMAKQISAALGRLAAYSCSAECLGYPHALFRAHREMRITDQEAESTRMELLDLLGSRGLKEFQVRGAFQDYHDVINMRHRRIL